MATLSLQFNTADFNMRTQRDTDPNSRRTPTLDASHSVKEIKRKERDRRGDGGGEREGGEEVSGYFGTEQ